MSFIAWTALLFTSFVFLHTAISKISGPHRFMVKILVTGLPFLFSPLVLAKLFPNTFWFFIGQPELRWVCILVLLTLWCGYVVALVCTQNSVSLRILDEMFSAQRGLSFGDIEGVYSEEESVESRLALMEKNGYVLRTGPSIEITEKAKFFVYATTIFRNVFGIINPG